MHSTAEDGTHGPGCKRYCGGVRAAAAGTASLTRLSTTASCHAGGQAYEVSHVNVQQLLERDWQ